MKRNGTYILFWLILFTCSSLTSVSQTFKAEADRDKILIGEQVVLTIKVEGVKAQENFIRSWINLPDTFNHFEVVERGKIDTIAVGRDINYQQTITITSFDSGQWQIPALKLMVERRGVNTNALSSQPLTIDVLPVDVSQLQDYHDIKDIFEVENELAKYILIGIIAVTLISLIVIFVLSRRKKNIIVQPSFTKGKQSPLEWALSALDSLQKQDLATKGQIKQYYLQLTHICREYFQQQLQQKALQQTSDELMLNLQPIPIQQPVKTSFFQFIRLADTVKFAKYLPSSNEQEQSLQVAKQMLIEVDQWNKYSIPSTNKPIKS